MRYRVEERLGMLGYAELETALARLHGAGPDAQRGAFRGRLKHLQRLGLPLGDKPGKGKRIDYSEEQVWQLALALELAQFGVDPSLIVELITKQWWFLKGGIREANRRVEQKETDDYFFVAPVAFMSAAWGTNKAKFSEDAGFLAGSEMTGIAFEGDERRALVVNVSEILRSLSNLLNANTDKK